MSTIAGRTSSRAQGGYTVVRPGEAPTYQIAGDLLSFKLGAAQTGGRYAVAEVTVHPGGGPPPHVHRHEDELFYVLDGQFAFTLGDRVILASAGFCRNLPKGVPHTFKNVGSRPGRLLVVSTPGTFDPFVRAGGTRVDDPRTANAAGPATAPTEAEVERMMLACQQFGVEMRFNHQATGLSGWHNTDRPLWVLGERVCIKARAADTNGSFSVAEVISQPGGGVPPHMHYREDEFFYVLEGHYAFEAAGRTITAPPGTFIHVPKGTPHGFRNVGPTPGRLLDYHTPAGFERFAEDAAQSVGRTGTTAVTSLPDRDVLKALLGRHGMELQPV